LVQHPVQSLFITSAVGDGILWCVDFSYEPFWSIKKKEQKEIFQSHRWQTQPLIKSIPLWKTGLQRTVSRDMLPVLHASCPSALPLLQQPVDHAQSGPLGLSQPMRDTPMAWRARIA